MNRIKSIGKMGMALLLLFACSPATVTRPDATATLMPTPEVTPTVPAASQTPLPAATATPKPTPEATPTATVVPQAPSPYLLAEPGPYQVARSTLTSTDASRDNREVGITVWYPAMRITNYLASVSPYDAKPDRSGAPYPLILSSTKVANILAPYLVSHGFTWVSVDKIDSYMMMSEGMIDQPRDIVFALNQVAAQPPPKVWRA